MPPGPSLGEFLLRTGSSGELVSVTQEQERAGATMYPDGRFCGRVTLLSLIVLSKGKTTSG